MSVSIFILVSTKLDLKGHNKICSTFVLVKLLINLIICQHIFILHNLKQTHECLYVAVFFNLMFCSFFGYKCRWAHVYNPLLLRLPQVSNLSNLCTAVGGDQNKEFRGNISFLREIYCFCIFHITKKPKIIIIRSNLIDELGFCWTVISHQGFSPFPSTSVRAQGLFVFLPQSTVHNLSTSEMSVPVYSFLDFPTFPPILSTTISQEYWDLVAHIRVARIASVTNTFAWKDVFQ